MATTARGVFVMMSAATIGAAVVGCELMVQLDRSAVEVADSGCPICSDASDDGNEEDAGGDAGGDGSPDAPAVD
jgi:hypothetical protein